LPGAQLADVHGNGSVRCGVSNPRAED
jgi:hypothetical protein